MQVTPECFRADVVPPRTMGTECEYNLQNVDEQGNMVPTAQYTQEDVYTAVGLRHVGQFLSNGAKLYWDVGHLEYATPESLGPAEAAVQDHEGIRIVSNMIAASGQPHRGVYRLAGTYLPSDGTEGYPGMSNAKGFSNGYHKNLLIPKWLVEERQTLTAHLLGAHLASAMWRMSGTVDEKGYVLSQKVTGIGDPVIMGYGRRTTHGSKPMAGFLTGDYDTVGDMGQWARLEIRFADPSLYRPMTELDLASDSLVLRIAEHAHKINAARLDSLALRDPVQAAKLFAHDMTFKATVPTVEGKTVTFTDLQESLATLAIELSEIVELPADEQTAAHRWLSIVDMCRGSNPAEGVYTTGARSYINFAARHTYLRSHYKESEINSENVEVAAQNLRWDQVLPQGIGSRYWQRVTQMRNETAHSIVPEVPQTRAQARVMLMSKMHGSTDAVSWVCAKVSGSTIPLTDPYSTEA